MELEATLKEAKKKAIQGVESTRPTPTTEQQQEAADIIAEYNKPDRMTWVEVLRKNLNYHGKNETVKRYPYWLAAKEMNSNKRRQTLLPNTTNRTE